MTMFRHISDFTKQLTRRNRPPDRTIAATKLGVTLAETQTGTVAWAFDWTDIEKIVAFKADLLTTDCIYLAFRHRTQETYYICHEELHGWTQLLAEIESRYGIDVTITISSIAHPPFEENNVVVWADGLP